ncbi:hypothetical protein [Gimesia panareensis]|uniref:hypothetical protein n=1 Tax=Gimesia panareensis TaxID=2527978 RepID=UPI001189A790|nr:hypothetical protein [Gimesia panareensis]QDU47934.1 hypothetical protein Pan110_02460 [Gimesia panareensis]
MIEFLLPAADALFSFLATYLIHSTLLGLLIMLALKYGPKVRSETRIAFLKVALVGPVLSSLVVSLDCLPHFGMEWTIASTGNSTQSAVMVAEQLEADHVSPHAAYTSANREGSKVADHFASTPATSLPPATFAGRNLPQGLESAAHSKIGGVLRIVCCVLFLAGSIAGGILILLQI